MPAIQSITVESNKIIIVNRDGTTSLNPLLLPSTNVTVVENWLNNTYLPGIVGNSCQVVAHVFSTNPLNCGVAIYDNGITIPDNWWQPT